ncbi:MAG TPA: branched-chain amino acid ABC transporter permease [Deltaproteobacteria bacterium]|nr:branched-chain amino acid ABC transporter permease [SAR324 cluster bacterium]HHZ78129.1 branched-chain amino acid ABC transporter permease [Candidatus Lambdaproteobacteria bacterium]HIN46750.1 branched-chain amino acid ABC transporter permease [Deltaproteobacteria bacterium]HIA58147.1 branched-chain amino acid ABC transporter permease [Candidatus Lambdaproteobacteria bacterium]HIO10609.1 branched-chain amino acid ABC transporter permease [Deltaproteobacteria bacterium]
MSSWIDENGPLFFLALLDGTVTAFVLALIALGLSLVFGVMRIVNIAHGEFFMLGAVFSWFAFDLTNDPLWGFLLALVVAPSLVGSIAVFSDRFILRKVKYHPESTIVATIGLLYVIQSVTLMVFGPEARAVEAPLYFRVQFPWFGYSGYKLIVAGMSAMCLLGVWLLMKRSKLGLYMRATQQDLEIAKTYGVPTQKIYASVFALGGGLAALAGVLVVPIRQADHLMGLEPLLLSFIVVIIGGLGSIRGTIVAAFIIGISDGIISVFYEPTLAKMLATLFVAMVLVLKPSGLYGEELA